MLKHVLQRQSLDSQLFRPPHQSSPHAKIVPFAASRCRFSIAYFLSESFASNGSVMEVEHQAPTAKQIFLNKWLAGLNTKSRSELV